MFQLMTLVSDKAVIDLIDNPPLLPPQTEASPGAGVINAGITN